MFEIDREITDDAGRNRDRFGNNPVRRGALFTKYLFG
jgi:hypothetical protein